jgi:hypothetical protein
MYKPHERTAILRMKVAHRNCIAIVAITLMIFSVSSALAQPAGKKMTLDSLMKQHLEALGGPTAVKNIKSIRVISTGKFGGQAASMVETFKLPGKQKIEATFGVYHMTSAYDGKVGWNLDPGGDLSHDDDSVQTSLYDLYLASHAYAFDGPAKGKVTLRPERESGTEDYIVDVTGAGFFACVFYFDPQTYLIDKVKDKDGMNYYSDYRKFGGVQFPTVEKQVETDPSENGTSTVSNVEINLPVSDSLFEAPKNANPAEPVLEHK